MGKTDPQGPPAQWFEQRINHFDYQDDGVWRQRYFVNDSYYNPATNFPVFFILGGEGAISNRYVTNLKAVSYASDLGALVVALEHRFYGLSQPTGDLSLASLRYLNSRQALADAAYFIQTFLRSNHKYRNHGPIIVFGGSYPGALSAWFRMKYPHIATASIASSAPVRAVLDMVTYLTDVDNALVELMGANCLFAYRDAFSTTNRLARSSTGAQNMSSQFNTCTPIPVVTGHGVPRDVAIFFSNIIGVTMGTVQYNAEISGQTTVTQLCDVMTNVSLGSPYQRLVQQWNLYGGSGGDCMDISYPDQIAQLRNTSVGEGGGVGIRQWTYQTCTEFGYFQTTDAPASKQPFGNLMPLQLSLDFCADAFGSAAIQTSLLAPSGSAPVNKSETAVRNVGRGNSKPTSPLVPRITETNILYGSNVSLGATNILYVNGDVDPWHTLSIVTNQTSSLLAILIPGAAHCSNMEPYIPGVTPVAVRNAQAEIEEIIRRFIYSPPKSV